MKRRLFWQQALGAVGTALLPLPALANRPRPSCCVCGKPAVGKVRKFGMKLMIWEEQQDHLLIYRRSLCRDEGCRMWLLAVIRTEATYYFHRQSGTYGDFTMAMTGEVTVTPAVHLPARPSGPGETHSFPLAVLEREGVPA